MRRPRSVLPAITAALVLAGCAGGAGSSGSDPEAVATGEPGADGVVQVTGTDNLQWDPPALEAPAGGVAFRLTCEERVNHNLVVEVDGERTMVAECAPGATSEGVLELAAGEYPFVCTIPGHESSMRGTLTVG